MVLLSGDVHETVPLFQGPGYALVARRSLQSMSSEHHCCRIKNLPTELPSHWTWQDRSLTSRKKLMTVPLRAIPLKKILQWLNVIVRMSDLPVPGNQGWNNSQGALRFDRVEQSQSWIASCRLMLKSVLWLWLPLAVLPLMTMSTYGIWLPFRFQLFKPGIANALFLGLFWWPVSKFQMKFGHFQYIYTTELLQTHAHTKRTVQHTVQMYLTDCMEAERQTWANTRSALVFRDPSYPVTHPDSWFLLLN